MVMFQSYVDLNRGVISAPSPSLWGDTSPFLSRNREVITQAPRRNRQEGWDGGSQIVPINAW